MSNIEIFLDCSDKNNFDLLIVKGRPAIGDGLGSYSFVKQDQYIVIDGIRYLAHSSGWCPGVDNKRTIVLYGQEEINIYDLVWVGPKEPKYPVFKENEKELLLNLRTSLEKVIMRHSCSFESDLPSVYTLMKELNHLIYIRYKL